MVNTQMRVTQVGQGRISLPFVRHDDGTLMDVPPYETHKGVPAAVRNEGQGALPCFTAYRADDPLSGKHSTAVVLPLGEDAFVNLHRLPGPSYDHRVAGQPLSHNVPQRRVPLYDVRFRHTCKTDCANEAAATSASDHTQVHLAEFGGRLLLAPVVNEQDHSTQVQLRACNDHVTSGATEAFIKVTLQPCVLTHTYFFSARFSGTSPASMPPIVPPPDCHALQACAIPFAVENTVLLEETERCLLVSDCREERRSAHLYRPIGSSN